MAKAKPIRKVDRTAPVRQAAARMIGQRLDEMLAWEKYLAAQECVQELHQMRIAAKRLRYTLEVFQEAYASQEVVAPVYGKAIEAVRTLQDHLGEIHDADVLTPSLTEQLAQLLSPGYGVDGSDRPVVGVHHVDFDAAQGLIALCREAREGRDRRYRLLLGQWQQLKEAGLFAQLRALLDWAVNEPVSSVDRSVSTVLAEEVSASDTRGDEGGSGTAPDASVPAARLQEVVHEEEPQSQVVARGRVARSARRSAGATGPKNGVGHSGTGSDSGEGSAEGGPE
jgi:hypothetical protein